MEAIHKARVGYSDGVRRWGKIQASFASDSLRKDCE